jgi:hypothetical protein
MAKPVLRRPAVKPAASKPALTKRPVGGSKGKPSTKPKAGFFRGAEGFKRAAQQKQQQDQEYERRKERPFDFRLKPGDSAEVVLLDQGDPFFVSLHKVQTGPKRWEDVPCIADTGQRCPACEATGKEGQYAMVLTALDRREYRVQKGPNRGKTIKVSKKLVVVKGRNLPKFARAFETKLKGNFRGVKVLFHRDGEKEAAIGEDVEFGGRLSEAALAKYGDVAKPAPYERIFELPSREEMMKRYKFTKSGTPGSEEFEDDADEDGQVDW